MQTARNCVLVGLWGENCKGVGSADCKKLCTGMIVGENCKGVGSADCERSYNLVRTAFHLISQSVWNPNESIMFRRIVFKCNCITVGIVTCLSAVCHIVFGLKQKDAYTLFSLNSAAVYAIRDAPAKQAGLEFNAGKCDVGFALIWSHHRIVLEARLA